MAKVMGIDFGDRRTGIAVSDDAGIIAFPRTTLDMALIEQTAAAVVKSAEEEKITAIIVGYPVNMNGTPGPRAARTDQFIQELQKRCTIPTIRWDERLSTRIAEATLLEAGVSREKRRGVVDKLAAQVILQGYLDSLMAANEEDTFDV